MGSAKGTSTGTAGDSASQSRANETALAAPVAKSSGGALYGHYMDHSETYSGRVNEREYDRRRSSSPSVALTKADVVDWTERGMSDEIIIERIERSKAVFQVTAAEQNELRDKGVSPAVIHAMRATARR